MADACSAMRDAIAALTAIGVASRHGVGAASAQETRSTTLLTTEHYLDWERVSDAQISPDGSRIVYTRQHVNKLEDKWDSELWILNADGSQHRFLVKGSARALVAGRQAAAVSRRGRAEGLAALRALGRRRRAGDADHARHRDAAQRALVARRQVDRVLDVRRRAGEVDDQHAAPSRRARSGRRRRASSARMHYRQDQVGFSKTATRICSSCRPTAARRAQLTTGQVERRRGRAARRRVDRLDARQQVDRRSTATASPDADMQYQTSQLYVVDVATGAIRDLVTKAGRVGQAGRVARRPHGRVHRLRADRPLAHGQRSVRRSRSPAAAATCGRSAATSIAIRSTCAGRRTAPACTSTPTIAARATSSSRRSSAASSRSRPAGTC